MTSMSFTAKDVQEVRQTSGAGMMDAKRALEESRGDKEQALQILREKGLAATAKRAERENAQGAVSLFVDGQRAAMVLLKCETDFVASSEQFKTLAHDLAALVAQHGEDAVSQRQSQLDQLRITLKENIELGRVVRIEAAPGNVLESYLHVQGGRGVNGVLVELAGGTSELAHDIAVHVAFARPTYLSRDQVPAEDVERERTTLEAISRNEGKPEAALPKIVEGRINGYFKDLCLLEQSFAKDEKRSIADVLAGATIAGFVQVEIG
jgi:elongation factor Ts